MLFGLSFTAKPGREAELERLLADPEFVRIAADRMGASLDALFVQGNRFTQVFDVPDADANSIRERVVAAESHPEMRMLLRTIAPLLDDPFDPDDPTSIAAFVQRHRLKLSVAARRAPAKAPANAPAKAPAKASSVRPPIGAAPR